MKYKTVEVQQQVSSRFSRHNKITKLIKIKASPTLQNISIALGKDVPSIYINTNTLLMCKEIYINGKTITFPIPHTKYVKDFKDFAGAGYIKKYNITNTIPIIGCYYIYSEASYESYVGQSKFLSKRVREHAGLNNKATKSIVESFKGTGKVTLFPVDRDVNMPLRSAVFLTILEQYLFLYFDLQIIKYLLLVQDLIFVQ